MRGECLQLRAMPGYFRIEVAASAVASDTKAQLASELAEVCTDLGFREDVRAVVLAFSGDEVRRIGAAHVPVEGVGWPSAVELVAGIPQPVIAAIEGDALGLALELAMACDLRVGTEGARFGLTQVVEGSMPADGGTQRLARLVGETRALEMLLTGELLSAEEAHHLGLVHRLVAPERLGEEAASLAEGMASQAPFSLTYVKEALHQGMDLTLEQGLRMERDLYLLLYTTQDRVEGITAFKEKRMPAFHGR